MRVELRRLEAERVRLSVSDDGVGLPAGFDLKSAGTLGLELVETLAEQLGADVTVDGRPGSTRFALTFAAHASGPESSASERSA